MKDPKIKNRIVKLRKEISRLRSEYHEKNNPKVTDDVYESLSRELKDLESKYPEYLDPNSAINRVAGKPLPSFQKVKHDIRMLSLNDVFSEEEITDWETRISKILESSHSLNYFCEVKLDGLTASLHYKDGVFIKGATRGDGWIGEDVTENLKMISSIPLRLDSDIKGDIEVRGEVVMTKKAWEKLNKKQEESGKTIFANTRNAAAGSLRQLDPQIVKERNLDFFAWDIAQYPTSISNHSDKHKILKDIGFQIAPYDKKAKNLKEVFSFIKEIGKVRAGLPYGTDGMVISIDNLEIQESLGYVGKAPRYMTAYKYEAERATTVVTDITVNVGRTGVMTPLAHFNSTLVAGSTISKATLHNMDQIERLDIRVGDTVVIQKAGDVIPEVVEVLTNMRTGKEKKFKMPENCPVCGSVIERKKAVSSNSSPALSSSVAYYCTNKNCSARSRRGMQHFVNIFEIYEIGPKILDRLKDEGLITDAADLFTLEKVDLSGLERFGEKSADNIIKSIDIHKKVLLWRFIYALGIIHVGEQTSHDLANHFGSLTEISKASEESINNIENIGPVVSKSIYEYFKQKENLAFMDKLFKNGVIIDNTSLKGTFKLKDKIFVLTGTLKTLSRDDAKKMIIKEGGRVSSSVSNKTDYIVVGAEPGSKYDEAKKIGVRTLIEDEFLKIL
ncbi:MAG: NAD-dependent DNA ligase LigA [Candidatus Nomurabacteria bacterium]|nr:NAD-dependent DNA ligase LigA [Candidatus Nomurabacteria bacterium]